MTVTAPMVAQIIRDHDANRPRSRQTSIGPSGLGHPCDRNLTYHALNTPRQPRRSDPLPAWIGTAAHTGMEQALKGNPDWLTEIRGTLGGYGISGTLDAYHIPSATIVDWKFVGPSALTKHRAHVDPQYRTQVHLYGLIAANGGLPVEHVAVCFIPRNGGLDGIHLHTEPWDEHVAEQALKRWEQLSTLAQLLGPQAAHVAPTSPAANCAWCPWWLTGSQDPTSACAGAGDHNRGTPTTIADALGTTHRKNR